MTPDEVKDNLRGAFRRQSKVLRKYDDGENVKEVMGENAPHSYLFGTFGGVDVVDSELYDRYTLWCLWIYF